MAIQRLASPPEAVKPWAEIGNGSDDLGTYFYPKLVLPEMGKGD